MQLSVYDYIHPSDEEARKNLEAIPGFKTALKSFMKIGIETLLHGTNMASKIRLSPTQLGHIYKLLPPICDELNIKEPEFYLEMNPTPNAYTTGDSLVAITLTSGLVEYLTENELIAVIAHECAHIACRHVLYGTMAQMLLNGTSGFLGTLTIPIKLGLLFWMRRAELSCDRAASIVTTSTEPIINTMIRLSGGPKSITENINIFEYAKQAESYDVMLESKWNNLLQSYAIMGQDHPFCAVRVNEILKWAESDQYKLLLKNKKIELDGFSCKTCGKIISKEWKFCKYCGSKV